MEFSEFNWAEDYRSLGVRFPYHIGIRYGDSDSDGFAEVLALPQEITINGQSCEKIEYLSEQQLRRKNIETRFTINLKRKKNRDQRSEARNKVRNKLGRMLETLREKGLISY